LFFRLLVGPQARRGISPLEVLCLVLLLMTAYLGERLLAPFGLVPGIIGMIGLPLGLIGAIELLAWLERELIMGRKPFPVCVCAAKEIDELPLSPENGKQIRTCSCGRRYEWKYTGRIVLLTETGETDFARWKAFRSWERSPGEGKELPPPK
jgi:hypothetical protein